MLAEGCPPEATSGGGWAKPFPAGSTGGSAMGAFVRHPARDAAAKAAPATHFCARRKVSRTGGATLRATPCTCTRNKRPSISMMSPCNVTTGLCAGSSSKRSARVRRTPCNSSLRSSINRLSADTQTNSEADSLQHQTMLPSAASPSPCVPPAKATQRTYGRSSSAGSSDSKHNSMGSTVDVIASQSSRVHEPCQ